MKFLIQILSTIIIGFILELFLPWWTIAIASFAVAYLVDTKSLASFFAGFLGIAILWVGMALYIDQSTHSILTEKVNRLLPLNAFLLTGLIGGLVGGLSALTGSLVRSK